MGMVVHVMLVVVLVVLLMVMLVLVVLVVMVMVLMVLTLVVLLMVMLAGWWCVDGDGDGVDDASGAVDGDTGVGGVSGDGNGVTCGNIKLKYLRSTGTKPSQNISVNVKTGQQNGTAEQNITKGKQR